MFKNLVNYPPFLWLLVEVNFIVIHCGRYLQRLTHMYIFLQRVSKKEELPRSDYLLFDLKSFILPLRYKGISFYTFS